MGKSKVEEEKHRTVTRPAVKLLRPADWAGVDAGKLRGCIAVAGGSGGALRFGYTRDGGAYAIGIYGLGDPYTAYVRPGDDVEAFLDELAQAYAAEQGT